jgi:hypothetical protein
MHVLISGALRFARRARKVDTVAWHSVASYAHLLSERRPSILWLHEPAALSPNSSLLFSELVNAEIREDHFRVQPQPAGIGVACLRDTLVSGYSLVGRASTVYRLPPVTPLYVDEYLSRGSMSDDLPVGNRRLIHRRKRLVPGASVLLTHWNSGVYGHWLLEGMPKLLLLRQIAASLPPFRILLPRKLPEFVTGWIRFLLPDSDIEIYDERTEYLHCDTLLLPTLLMHPEHYFHPTLAPLVDELCRSASADAAGGRKLYVSRVASSNFRRLSNQAEIEEIAVKEGLTLVRPETFSIADQIEMFASADLVVGEFGSAMHNALFSPSQTKIFCLNWINAMQSRIAQLKHHEIGYLLPSDGTAVRYVEGSPSVTYHIDAQLFRKCLRTLLEGSSKKHRDKRDAKRIDE